MVALYQVHLLGCSALVEVDTSIVVLYYDEFQLVLFAVLGNGQLIAAFPNWL